MYRIGLAALLAALFATPGVAAHAATPAGSSPVSPGYSQAMARDLGIATDQVAGRIAVEARAARAERSLRQSLGDNGFGGARSDFGPMPG